MSLAIVTGGSRGIGAGDPEKLAQDGFNILMDCASSVEKAEAVAEKCRAHGVNAYVKIRDVADYDACSTALKEIKEEIRRTVRSRQQCGHHPRRSDGPHEGGPVRRRYPHQPQGRIQQYSQPVRCDDDARQAGPYHQHHPRFRRSPETTARSTTPLPRRLWSA